MTTKRKKLEWMVYDASDFYAEKTICPTRRWALDVKDDYATQYTDADWRIAKVHVRLARRGK